MANNPFDPPIVQVKKTLDRGGISSVNKGFGSTRMQTTKSRPAPTSAPAQWYPENLGDLGDTDTETVPPEDGQALVWDADQVLWVPGDVASGGGGGGGGSDWTWLSPVVAGFPAPSTSNGSFNPMESPVVFNTAVKVSGISFDAFQADTYTLTINGVEKGSFTAAAASRNNVISFPETALAPGPVHQINLTGTANRRVYFSPTAASPEGTGSPYIASWGTTLNNGGKAPVRLNFTPAEFTPGSGGGGGGDEGGSPEGTGRVDSSTTPTSLTSTSNNEYTTRVKIKETFWLSSFSYYVSSSTTPELIMRTAGTEILSRGSLPVTTATGWATHTLTKPVEVKRDEYYYFTLKTEITRPTWRINGAMHQGPLWETNKVILEDLFRGATYDQTPGLRLTEYPG